VNSQLFLLVLIALMFGGAWYSIYSLKDKLFCTYRRASNQKIEKFVKLKSRYVKFDGKEFNVIPSCNSPLWYTRGLLGMLGLGTWVMTADYSYTSPDPYDPKTGKIAIISPEVRSHMDNEELMGSFGRGMQKQAGKKQGLLGGGYLGLLLIGAVALALFYLYNNQQTMGQHLIAIENALKVLGK